MRKLFEKYVIVKYIFTSYAKTLLISIGSFTILFAILEFTELYARIERALDLKYNSPFVLLPLFVFAALAVLCFFVGFLLYFYKYKRSKSKSAFGNAFSNVLNKKTDRKDSTLLMGE